MSPNKKSDFGFHAQQVYPGDSNRRSYAKAFGLILSGYFLARVDLRSAFRFGSLDLFPGQVARLVGDVQWYECEGINDPKIECGSIVVPLDYFDLSAGTATIAVAKYKAKPSLRRGSVFVNPGGPGGSGTMLATRAGKGLAQTRMGPHYDIIGFDPRGIGATTWHHPPGPGITSNCNRLQS